MDFSDLEAKYQLPRGMVGSIASIETGGHPDPDNAISHAGAIGRMQLMPKTAKELGVDPFKPEQNLEGGAKYLRWLLDTTKDEKKAVVAYNYGIGNLRKAERNAELTGRDWTNFIKKKESRDYLGKYLASKEVGVHEIDKVEQKILPKTAEKRLIQKNINDLAWVKNEKDVQTYLAKVEDMRSNQNA